MAFEFIRHSLEHKARHGLLRQRLCIKPLNDNQIQLDGKTYLNFSSNDYLGLAQSQALARHWQQGIDELGAGSGASPLVTGYHQAHAELEQYIQALTGREAVLLFNSGFAANHALCQALMSDGGTIVADKLSHASLLDGALASDGRLLRFKHNDLAHLQQKLQQTQGDTLVVTEGVFSMDGDVAPITEIVSLAEKHQSWVMLDDAHGFGVFGESGAGSCELHQLNQQQVPVLMATFGKAIGTAGAFVAGSQQLIDFLVNSARHYIYSTAMPAHQARATLAALQLIKQQPERRQQLQQNIQHFRHLAKQHSLALTDSETAIQPVIIGDNQQSLNVSHKLKQQGLWVTAIRPPTVPKGTARLRITLNALHTPQQIETLVKAIAEALAHV